ncbi:MAG: NAD(P)-binding protein [Chloroflexaceae bacterium]|nr:NAD(P)-binding protein [Chloroflexaceae bacterium]
MVGAGVAGLAAAQVLKRRGVACTVYEKSRGVGGRAATRTVAGVTFDHGAQYVKAPTADLERLFLETHAIDIERPVWVFNAAGTIREGDPNQNADPKWAWEAGITALSKAMAQGLDIRFEVQIDHLELLSGQGGYRLLDAAGNNMGHADAVLLTPPGPQTAAIVAASTLLERFQVPLLTELQKVTYRRILAVSLLYAQRPTLPWYALVNIDRRHPISWVACEHDKPGHVPADHALLIAHMAHDFATLHWDAAAQGTYGTSAQPLPTYVAESDRLVQALVGSDLGPPLWANVQRWGYALPNAGADFERLNDTRSGLYFAGDYTVGRGRVHEAIESGWHVAARIIADLL